MTGSLRQRGPDAWELRIYLGVDSSTVRERWATKTVHDRRSDSTFSAESGSVLPPDSDNDHQDHGGDRLYRVVRAVVSPLYRAGCRVRTEGLDNVPIDGPVILAANHMSFFDSVVLTLSVPRRTSGKAEYLDSWKTRFVFPALGMIPIRRSAGRQALAALDTAAAALGPQLTRRNDPSCRRSDRRGRGPWRGHDRTRESVTTADVRVRRTQADVNDAVALIVPSTQQRWGRTLMARRRSRSHRPPGSSHDSRSPATTSLNSFGLVWLGGRSVVECGVPVGAAPVGGRVEQHPKRVHVRC